MYKSTVSGVLFALIVKNVPSVSFFYTSVAIDAMDKYQVLTAAEAKSWYLDATGL